MSGSGEYPHDGGYGGGWSHNWYPSSSTFAGSSSASPDSNFSPPANTQSSGTPGAYRPYPVDLQNAPEGQFGWSSDHGSTQPLSQIPEGGNEGGGGDGGDPNVRTPYTPKEVEKLFEAWISVSEDASVGTNQTGDTFWKRIQRVYLEIRPQGTVRRTVSMLRNAFARADLEIKKFQGLYLEEQRVAGSGGNDLDIITNAMSAYATLLHKPFKHFSTWQKVHHLPRWKSGTESSSDSSSRRRSRSDLDSDEVASQLGGANLNSSDADAGPSQRRGRRPTGKKKTRDSDRATPSQPPVFVQPPPPAPIPPNPNTLYPILNAALLQDTSRMTPEQRDLHSRMIQSLSMQLSMLPGFQPPPPSN